MLQSAEDVILDISKPDSFNLKRWTQNVLSVHCFSKSEL